MSTAAALPAPMDERQRLTATLVISLLLHGLLILCVGFAVSEDAPLVPTLDVIFSQTSTPLTPKQADFLAQANQQGGGNHDTAQRPRDSQPGVVPQDRNGLAPQAQRATTVQAPLPTQTRVVSSRRGEQAVPTPQPNPQTDPLSPADAQRVQRDAEMARLAAEVHLRSEQYAKRPNRKFVSASTREYAYANYLRAWVDRAERVGNLNYPDEARRRRLGGKVVITVGVRRDGSVESSRVLVSSGAPVLDAAALRVVQLAQPFPPLPRSKDDVDILQVTRTWLFLPGGELHDDR
ncbi:energy transducer TonB [Xanthomonas campestris]|uniref:TonB-like protein n=1 Tax=Xanthomonas campestris pv. campestris (strain B100) TaxID=509169 RepID=B0RQ40_XANCB|nr:energy transducer TonB [Xanthomonas campestris]MCC5092907.1 energy transducer TonB [Xanthomonas campestris pv. incanae]MCD0273582.1 energy transducer TonB [Xanthomonas campestris pv. campestris]MCF8788867.1 energy transducer TonB [Xanthomonas campestris pv. campestris]MCF8799461.1 energy transducer TonB [Xanthomonas campestris pv. campestris]MCF8805529.1 energy transducer TonB [Xanthomonas campestris pv. campestris]